MMDSLFIFVTTTIPKAGAQVGPVPLTLNLVLLALVVLRNPAAALHALRAFRGYFLCFAVVLVFGFYGTVIAWGEGLGTFAIAQRVIVMLSPLAAVAAFRVRPGTGARIVGLALVLVSAYALLEFVAGISETAVQGITYTFGQSLETKPIGYDGSSDSGKKMPSTFQNGNSLGILCVLGLALMLSWRPEKRGDRVLRVTAMSAGVLGLLLCGSRSIIIPLCMAALFMVHHHVKSLPPTRRGMVVAGLLGGLLVVWAVLSFTQNDVVSAFWQRNVVETANDPTASGRTGQWAAIREGVDALSGRQLLRLLLIGQSPSWGLGGEGLPAFFTAFGLPATLAFYGGLLVVARRLWESPTTRSVAWGVLCVVFAFTVDTSFFYPPNLMNVFLISALALRRPEGRPASGKSVARTEAHSQTKTPVGVSEYNAAPPRRSA